MTTNFPTGLDTFVNPNAATDTLASVPHDSQHANANDAIAALEAKVGVDGSAVTSSLDYRVNDLELQFSVNYDGGAAGSLYGGAITINGGGA